MVVGVVVLDDNPSTGRLRQEDGEFKLSLSYIARTSQKKKKAHFASISFSIV
jgi:hypothetical protein